MSSGAVGQHIIPLEEGWDNEIKAKVGRGQIFGFVFVRLLHSLQFSCFLVDAALVVSRVSHAHFVFQQAIDKLEAMLNGDMKSGNMFGPKEYVQIYT